MIGQDIHDGRRSNVVTIVGYRNGKFHVRGQPLSGPRRLVKIHKEKLIALLNRHLFLSIHWDDGDREAVVYAMPWTGDRSSVEKLVLSFFKGTRRDRPRKHQPADVREIIMAAGGHVAITKRILNPRTGKPIARVGVYAWERFPEKHCLLIAEMSGRPAREVWLAGTGHTRADIFASAAEEAANDPW
jgi:hypothetical protein